MADNDNLKKLHANLSQKWEGFAVPYETFEKDMQNEDNLKKLHTNLSQKWDGFAVDYDTFKSDMGLKKKTFLNKIQRLFQSFYQRVEKRLKPI